MPFNFLAGLRPGPLKVTNNFTQNNGASIEISVKPGSNTTIAAAG